MNTVISGRASLWLAFLLAALSFPFNVVFLLLSSDIVGHLSRTAGENPAVFLPLAFFAHVGLFSLLVLPLRIILRRASLGTRVAANLATGALYSAVVIAYFLSVGPIASL